MINKFTTRIFVSLALAFLVYGALSGYLLIKTAETHEQGITQRIHRDLAQHVVDNYLLYKEGKPDYEEAKKTFHDLMILGANFEFYLLNKHGEIVASDVKGDNPAKSIDLKPVQDFLTVNEDTLILGDDPQNRRVHKVFSVAPIFQMGEVYGYLYVVIGSQAHDRIQSEVWYERLIESSLGVLLVASLFTLTLLAFVINYVSRPLTRLINQVKYIRSIGFKRDNLEQNKQLLEELKKWPSDSKNDIQLLGRSFYNALNKIQEQYNNVVSIDDLRKELLSHLSHDLRTPLASLLGYLETWEIQEKNLSPEKSREYIATARSSAEKIAKLVEQLFELAHLDGNNVNVRKEPIAIAELIQDLLQKFSISAQKKNIILDVNPRDSSIVVRADIEKLERVFTNLIENAIRHTPTNGSVMVRIQRESGFATIEVSDTGIGIPEQDLPHIFDPHFKAGNSVRENTAHGGLGLAITKKLLELHDTVINVDSNLDKGTTFRFSLEAA